MTNRLHLSPVIDVTPQVQALIAVGLVSILGQTRPRVWVDGMYSRASPHRMSYFVNILVKENDHIIITAR